MEEKSDKNISEEKDHAPIATTILTPIKPVTIENIPVLSKESTDSAEIIEKIISAEKIETVFDSNQAEEIKGGSEKTEKSVTSTEKPRENTTKQQEDIKTKDDINDKLHEVKLLEIAKEDETPSLTNQLPKQDLDKRRIGSATASFISEKINRNQSDIFSLKDETTIASSIFSVNGSPSRKVYRKVQKIPSSNVFPFGQISEPPSEQATPRDRMRDKDSYHDVKRPSSSLRNPLTGTGLNSNDEYKFKGNKRTDGNPLLGLGYTPEATPSTHRIPPGGYSHKLW